MFLLDTCTLLWLALKGEQKNLSELARNKIQNHSDSLFISSFSAFEISMKQVKKMLILPLNSAEWFEKTLAWHGIKEISVNSRVACRANNLPFLHKDPADRIIMATALEHHFSIITPDHEMKKYSDIETVW